MNPYICFRVFFEKEIFVKTEKKFSIIGQSRNEEEKNFVRKVREKNFKLLLKKKNKHWSMASCTERKKKLDMSMEIEHEAV